MEAMVALMMVTIALTAFFGMLAYSEIGGSDDTVTLDTGFIEDLQIVNGSIVGETQKQLDHFVEKNGLNGTRLTVDTAGTLSDASLLRTSGMTDGNNVGTITGTFSIRSDDGRTFAASYEVVYWWN